MSITITPTHYTVTDQNGTHSGAGWDFSDLYEQGDIYISGDDAQPEMVCEPFTSEADRTDFVAAMAPRLRALGVAEAHMADVAALCCLGSVHYSYDQYDMVMDALPQYGLDAEALGDEAWQGFLLTEVEELIYKPQSRRSV